MPPAKIAPRAGFVRLITLLSLPVLAPAAAPAAEPVALWLFDEPAGLYPSTPLDSSAGLDAPLVLGLGGTVVEGRFGQALATEPYPPIEIPDHGNDTAYLWRLPVPPGRTREPLAWPNAQFTALMTSGERHLRKEVTFASPTRTDLNLGDFDWTVEFWYRAARTPAAAGVVFEIGTGPRGENALVTRLLVEADRFVLENQPAGVRLAVPSAAPALGDPDSWHHYAFVYGADDRRLEHYVDGRRQPAAAPAALRRLPAGDEDYLSLGRDGDWQRPLPGRLDELRFSRGRVYAGDFPPPGSFAPPRPRVPLVRGLPLLFGADAPRAGVVALGSRKHLLIDDALFERSRDITFAAHPPLRIERVMDGTQGQFRKHLTVVEDDEGLIRIFNGGPDDRLIVHVSRDGLRFEEPDTGLHYGGRRNVVIDAPAALGRPIIDPNGPPEHRWKYISGVEGRGVYLFTSPDGWKWTRQPMAALNFRSGSQSGLYYDEQRGLYVGLHRTGFPLSQGGGTRREFVRAETDDIFRTWPVRWMTQAQVREIAKTRSLRSPQPWWLDNGPLTPGDFGIELPTVFAPDDRIDPPGSGVYVPKATKYPWAPDAYVAFPAMYFDYEEPAQPATRRVLYEEKSRGLGSGQVETQLAVSRDGLAWRRFPAPVYVGVGRYQGRDLHQIYMGEGLVRRGDEIWQYFYGQEEYHSPARRNPAGNGIYRTVQRLDGFVSAEAPYERLGEIVTRPLTFAGNRLVLNIDTRGLGYAQVGFTDEAGRPVPGYGVEDGVFINGNFVAHEVEWLGRGTDVSALAGRTVRLVIRMRNTSLYALQFVVR
ncbi:MAG: LamG domain-containing protein [Opitutaceae bacterium]|nr:LamG domain-containing protein [Opitutaceae bacterium]